VPVVVVIGTIPVIVGPRIRAIFASVVARAVVVLFCFVFLRICISLLIQYREFLFTEKNDESMWVHWLYSIKMWKKRYTY